MRVFVTGTGRCGTKTFAMACRHMTNFTSGHETHAGRIGDLDYPDGHIEADPHLVHVLPLMLDKYPGALWVHLLREHETAVPALARRPSLDHYAAFCFQARRSPSRRAAAAMLYANTVALLKRLLPEGSMVVQLEQAQDQWPAFWEWIGADGDYEASAAEWDRRYNASKDASKG